MDHTPGGSFEKYWNKQTKKKNFSQPKPTRSSASIVNNNGVCSPLYFFSSPKFNVHDLDRLLL